MKTLIRFLRSSSFSPQGLTVWSLVMLLAFGVTHGLGFRDSMTILTGTIPLGSNAETTGYRAIIYMATYFGSVLLVPPMLLTALIISVWKRRTLQTGTIPSATLR